MKNTYTIEEIRIFEERLKTNPSDIELMNQLAIGYLNVPEAGGFNKVDGLLEKAHSINPSIKTANNLAYQMIVDWNEPKKALKLLTPFTDSSINNIKSINLIAYGYLLDNNPEKADAYYEVSSSFNCETPVEIIHNHAVVKSLINQLNKSIELNLLAIEKKDLNNQSFFNLMLNYIETSQHKKTEEELKRFVSSNKYLENNLFVSNHDISQLYYANENFDLAYEMIKEDEGYWISSFPEFAYILNKFDKVKFATMVNLEIEMQKGWIADLHDPNNEDTKEMTERELTDELTKRNNEVNKLQTLENNLEEQPKLNIREMYQTMHCGCLLYDCKVHRDTKN